MAGGLGSSEWIEEAGTELFMTEIRVVDWPLAVGWYEATLGLRPLLLDEERQFALLAAGSARLAVKGAEGTGPASGVRLVFLVSDVDAEYARLRLLGVEATPPADHPREPYRESRLTDPEGTPITLFSWRV